MKVGQISNEKALSFILGGKAFVTFQNSSTTNRYTYKIVKHKTDDIHFVHVLTSPDVYMYLGTIMNYSFRHSRKSKINRDTKSFIVFDYVYHHLLMGTLDPRVEIFHDGKCGRCGRQLTTPDSVQSGFGPECIKKI
jgi:hypothetical protein